jgi:NAD(P)-dependent dehydrogenase (short-subunit alcohol dehydrogenase family)
MSQQKVWFITGSSRGFGLVWTEAVLKRGDKLAASARNPKALKAFVEAYGDAVLPLKLDVTDRDAVFEAVRKAHQHFGRLDVILSNAGYGILGALEEVSIEDVRTNFETNVFGTLSVIQAALPLLRAQGNGHILPVSSVGAFWHHKLWAMFTPDMFGDPEATSEALFKHGVVLRHGPGIFDRGLKLRVERAPGSIIVTLIPKPATSAASASAMASSAHLVPSMSRRFDLCSAQARCRSSAKSMRTALRRGRSGKRSRVRRRAAARRDKLKSRSVNYFPKWHSNHLTRRICDE